MGEMENAQEAPVVRRKKKKALCHCCLAVPGGRSHGSAASLGGPGGKDVHKFSEEEAFNGGELFIKLNLDGEASDEWYAYCLPEPSFKSYAKQYDTGENVNVQGIVDNFLYLKEHLWDKTLHRVIEF